uniref:Uncharacterized protein n=1 Tax=Mola mola TaxID=94237 RepID=A0A3Q4BEV9_MOLML
MDFSGTWRVHSEENLEDFLKVVAPEMVIKMRKDVKPVVVIEQNDKLFTFTVKTPVCTHVHSFSIGKESEITTVDGSKFKCTVREENGKLIAETDKFTSVREIQGDNMVEVSDPGLHFLYKSVMFYFLTVSAFSSSFRLSLLAL